MYHKIVKECVKSGTKTIFFLRCKERVKKRMEFDKECVEIGTEFGKEGLSKGQNRQAMC